MTRFVNSKRLIDASVGLGFSASGFGAVSEPPPPPKKVSRCSRALNPAGSCPPPPDSGETSKSTLAEFSPGGNLSSINHILHY